jgi:hypothetical protein
VNGTTQELAELEARTRFYRIQKFRAECFFVLELWQLEKIHAGACGRKAVGFVASVVDAKTGVKILFMQQQ